MEAKEAKEAKETKEANEEAQKSLFVIIWPPLASPSLPWPLEVPTRLCRFQELVQEYFSWVASGAKKTACYKHVWYFVFFLICLVMFFGYVCFWGLWEGFWRFQRDWICFLRFSTILPSTTE